MTFHVPEKYRLKQGPLASTETDGNNGVFCFQHSGFFLRTIASDIGGWEHVSVSLERRNPTWKEMCHVKDLFWDENDWVIQFHPSKQAYVNNHPHCLHLWRPIGIEFPIPPSIFVGYAGMSVADAKKFAGGIFEK